MNKSISKKTRYSIVSITATSIDFGLLFLTTSLGGLSLIHANYISSTVGFIYSFIANKKFTFKTPGHRFQREAFLYISITLIGIWGIQPLVIWPIETFLAALHLHGLIIVVTAKIIASLVTFVWNYFGYTRIVFKHTKVTDGSHSHRSGTSS